MEFRTRHMSIGIYGGLAIAAFAAKPELFTSIQDVMLVLGPLIAMFTWDKIKGGSIRK